MPTHRFNTYGEKAKMKSLLTKPQIPLDQAVLCLDCSCVSNANHECPACSSRALLNLSAVLNRPSEMGYQLEHVAVAA
jgi:hypothetical protein